MEVEISFLYGKSYPILDTMNKGVKVVRKLEEFNGLPSAELQSTEEIDKILKMNCRFVARKAAQGKLRRIP